MELGLYTLENEIVNNIENQYVKLLDDYAKSKASYAPSGPQIAGMYATSIASPFVSI